MTGGGGAADGQRPLAEANGHVWPCPLFYDLAHGNGYAPSACTCGATDEVQRCQVCEQPNPVWFADSRLWNEVMGEAHDRDREAGGFLCPSCFASAADVYFDTTEWEVTGWQMIPELRRR